MTKLSKEVGEDEQQWWETPFELYWGICIKFWCPFAIFWLLMYSFSNDTKNMYGGYHMFWQWMGFLYPIGGFISFIVPLFVCTEKDPFNPEVDVAFDENDRAGCGASNVFEAMAADAKAKKKAAAAAKSGKVDDVEMKNNNI